MPEVLVLIIGLGMAGAAVLLPLWRSAWSASADDGLEADRLRHRVALEALRDVEADRRAGSLDDAAYAAQRAEAESRAATTRAALDAAAAPAPRSRTSTVPRAVPLAVAFLIGAVLVAGSMVPATGIANQTVVNQELAAAEAAEDVRQDRIGELTAELAASPDDTDTLSALADAYLAGSTQADLVAAANALQLLIALEPDRADAYERIIAAYLRAGDHANARAAHNSYAELASADPVEVAFLDGLIALRGEGDTRAAKAAFDRFLELAPDDPRARMVEALRDESDAG